MAAQPALLSQELNCRNDTLAPRDEPAEASKDPRMTALIRQVFVRNKNAGVGAPARK